MILDLIEKYGRMAAVVGLIGLLTLSVAVLSDSLMRTAFNSPIYGLSDLMEILTPVIVASCFPMALANRQNITIRYLGRSLPARPGQFIELIGQIAAFLVLVGFVWELGRYTYDLVEHGQFTWLLRLPIWPSWIVASVLLSLCIPIQGRVVLETFEHFRNGKALKNSEAELLDNIQREN